MHIKYIDDLYDGRSAACKITVRIHNMNRCKLPYNQKSDLCKKKSKNEKK